MKVFGKAFLSGVVFAILLIVLVPLFAEGMSPGDTITRLTSSPLKIVSILQIMCITGLVFGCVASFFSWIGRRNREREETDALSFCPFYYICTWKNKEVNNLYICKLLLTLQKIR